MGIVLYWSQIVHKYPVKQAVLDDGGIKIRNE
jgi:hypothetical protein